jgi:hypothetical protein
MHWYEYLIWGLCIGSIIDLGYKCGLYIFNEAHGLHKKTLATVWSLFVGFNFILTVIIFFLRVRRNSK